MGTSSNGQVLLVVVVALMVSTTAFASNFHHDFEPTFGDYRVRTYGHDGQFLSLSLDKTSGSGFRSKKEYLFGRFDMTMKFVAGDSAGTVTTFYLSSEGATHDEIDFEFLGNVSGQPYTIHTNVFSQGQGGREQQFHLWFDPTKNFHTYSIVWNPKRIIFLIDEMPIRVFENNEHHGIPFPKNQPMKVYSSLWNADSWATQGGLVKTDWSKAPFTAYYRNPIIDACEKSAGPACAFSPAARTFSYSASSTNGRHRRGWRNHELDSGDRKRLRWAQQRHMIYDYCKDHKRFPHGVPPECKHYRI